MILRNHALLMAGATVAQAFDLIYWLEMACKIRIDAVTSGVELMMPPQAIVDETYRLYRLEVGRSFGEMEWPAMLRFLDSRDSSFRDWKLTMMRVGNAVIFHRVSGDIWNIFKIVLRNGHHSTS